MGVFMCRKKRSELKAKRSDENLQKIGYDPNSESVEILEGVDHLEELKRRVLVSRLEDGIERSVEDLGFMEEQHDNITYID